MRVAVAGAGDTGQSIARALLHAGHQVLLIERYRAAYEPRLVPDADWMLGDACELATLQTAGIDTCDAVIAAAGDDKVNLVFAFLCKSEFGVERVVARINNPGNRELFTARWGVDVAVASPDSLVAAVEQQLAPRPAVRLLTLHGRASLIDITVAAGSPAEGRRLDELPLPDGAALVAVTRGGRLAPPARTSPLRAGDELLILAALDAEDVLRTALEPWTTAPA